MLLTRNCYQVPFEKRIVLRKFLFKHRLGLIGFVVGAVVGLLYWKRVGCLNGSCLITGKPMNSMIYFACMGTLVADIFNKESKTDGNEYNKPGQ